MVGGALYSRQRRWTEGGFTVKPGVGKQRRGSHGSGKAVAEISGAQRRPGFGQRCIV
jgi:hypothetical protein